MKDQLVQVISAFGAACKTDNAILIQLATEYTNQFLAKIDVTEIPEPVTETPPEDAKSAD